MFLNASITTSPGRSSLAYQKNQSHAIIEIEKNSEDCLNFCVLKIIEKFYFRNASFG